ncbi:hypothetical protein B1L04_18180 [Microcystis aeruginosa KW]|uniref:Uncharacterized protein n=1 Tax=Microcystis aeruginosa KW TaxID=1960155 RepID=A0A1V4BTY8_MICAE|nr:hypothetical protein [Microcystis aeruginosa]OPF17814.1 hypothetical protein B1L04_18180 [Microcystis aeruginosa KW]
MSEIQTKLCLAWFIARDTVPHTTAHRYKDFIADLFNYIRANHNNNQKIICSLKSWRDKKIAHNDKFIVKEVSSLTLKDCHLLLEFPKKVITIIGWAYLNTGYGVKNDYFLSSDSKRSSIALKRLISKLY